MKVELDLSTEQLQALDNDLTKLIENLNDEQRIDIVKSYINFQFDKLTYSYTDHWNTDKKEISQFGKELIDGLQKQIVNSISADIMSNEELKKFIADTVDEIKDNLAVIIKEAITTYIVENLFNSKHGVEEQIRRTLMERGSNYR